MTILSVQAQGSLGTWSLYAENVNSVLDCSHCNECSEQQCKIVRCALHHVVYVSYLHSALLSSRTILTLSQPCARVPAHQVSFLRLQYVIQAVGVTSSYLLLSNYHPCAHCPQHSTITLPLDNLEFIL